MGLETMTHLNLGKLASIFKDLKLDLGSFKSFYKKIDYKAIRFICLDFLDESMTYQIW